jgi:hypothetical protein
MSILGRLFGKKKDDLGLSDMGPLGGTPNFNEPLGSPDAGYGQYGQPTGYGAPAQQAPPGSFSPEAMGFERVPSNQSSPYSGPHQQSLGEINIGKDLEIISAKLDAIKAELDAMSQRLKRLERIADGETSVSAQTNKWNY